MPARDLQQQHQIMQTPVAIVIDVEMVHDAGPSAVWTSPGAGEPPPGAVALAGDSVGWWEGDPCGRHDQREPAGGRQALFLSPKACDGEVRPLFQGSDLHEFQVDDPVYYTPSGGRRGLNARKEHVYEYACHEGNYAMAGILGGARSQEAQGIKPSQGPGIFGTPIPTKGKPGE